MLPDQTFQKVYRGVLQATFSLEFSSLFVDENYALV